jgi:protoporphyrinogen oxidase
MISTIPLDSLGALLDAPPPEIAAAFGRLRCTELYYLDVALDAPPLLDLHWVYVPERRFPFYRVGCYSQFSSAMAPPGKAGLYIELADRAPPDPERLFPEVVRNLVEMRLIASASDVRFLRVRHLSHAYVIHDAAHEAALATIRPFLADAGIVSAGRYGAWNYSSMEDALLFGRDAARDVSEGNA